MPTDQPPQPPPRDKPRSSGRVTLSQVAQTAGVSPMSVSNAYRFPDRLQPETLSRVLAAGAQLGYVPDRVAGTLASGTSLVIGGLLPSMQNSSFLRYVNGLRSAAQAAGRRLILSLADTPEAEQEAVETLISLRVAGVVLIGGDHRPETLALLRQTSTAHVETWLKPGGRGAQVGYDAAAAMTAMVALHVAAGRRQIALIDHDGALAGRYRLRRPAFESAMAAHGLPAARIYPVPQVDSFAAGASAMAAILADDNGTDAVICPTDVVAAGAVLECQRRGIAVPGRIAISGWGNYEIGSQILPRLTTVEPDSAEMGRAAIAALLNWHPEQDQSHDTGFRILRRDSA